MRGLHRVGVCRSPLTPDPSPPSTGERGRKALAARLTCCFRGSSFPGSAAWTPDRHPRQQTPPASRPGSGFQLPTHPGLQPSRPTRSLLGSCGLAGCRALRRGCAHGDLHGRNVLVGIVRNRALWPAVFDYEHMSPCNLLGWDFVKMETELKIRAFPELFPGGSMQQFVRSVQDFEIDLADATEECYGRSCWPEAVAATSRQSRLRSLLLALRQQAGLHLGADRGRPREWLDEYYFLLACYGVSVVRWPTLQPRERIWAYVSAGVATARFLWNREG